jgi:Cd2+/Zn2+-exporting ATPase
MLNHSARQSLSAGIGAAFEGAVLLELRPETASRKSEDGTVEEVPTAALDIDDIVFSVLIRECRRMEPSWLGAAHWTGRPLRANPCLSPRSRRRGLEAIVNLHGVLEVQVTKRSNTAP